MSTNMSKKTVKVSMSWIRCLCSRIIRTSSNMIDGDMSIGVTRVRVDVRRCLFLWSTHVCCR
jgi:hypothetical protein